MWSVYLMNSRRGPSNESHGWRMDVTSTVSIANVNTSNETTTRPVHNRNDAQHCTLALNALRKSASPVSLPLFIIMLPMILQQTTELMNRLMAVESTSYGMIPLPSFLCFSLRPAFNLGDPAPKSTTATHSFLRWSQGPCSRRRRTYTSGQRSATVV